MKKNCNLSAEVTLDIEAMNTIDTKNEGRKNDLQRTAAWPSPSSIWRSGVNVDVRYLWRSVIWRRLGCMQHRRARVLSERRLKAHSNYKNGLADDQDEASLTCNLQLIVCKRILVMTSILQSIHHASTNTSIQETWLLLFSRNYEPYVASEFLENPEQVFLQWNMHSAFWENKENELYKNVTLHRQDDYMVKATEKLKISSYFQDQ